MKTSKEFDNVLDECLERVLVKGETVEQCLQRYPKQAAELEPLLLTALAAKGASVIQPHPEFRAKARYEFYSALREPAYMRSRPFFSWVPRWATIVTAVLVLLLAGGGTVTAANGSMPDSPIYPVKLATEQVRLVLTPSALGKAELYAELADKRVLEIARMASKNKPEQIERTARRLDAYLMMIAVLFSTEQVEGGVTLAPAAEEAPAVAEAPIVREAPIVKEAPAVEEVPLMPERARGGGARGIKTDEQAELRGVLTRQAVNHPQRLRALLKTAPQSAKPALLRAIAISETGYEKALEALD